MDRRGFLRTSSLAGGGLLLAINLNKTPKAEAASDQVFQPNAWLKIPQKGSITFAFGQAEMGQGISTGLAMALCEELEYPMENLILEPVGYHKDFINPAFQMHGTGGSTTTIAFTEKLRLIGATTRETLIQAAAQKWKVPAAECHADRGYVRHSKTKKKERFQSLVESAKNIQVKPPRLKDPKDFKLLGKKVKRLDLTSKTTGTAHFGIDSFPKGALVSSVIHAPVFGTKVKDIKNKSEILKMPGIQNILVIPSGVAVVGDKFWQVKAALEALDVQWSQSKFASLSTESLRQHTTEVMNKASNVFEKKGDIAEAKKEAATTVEATYEAPYLAHATMEPMNCAVHIADGKATVHVPTQAPGIATQVVARYANVKPENITIKGTLLGGGFGRRFQHDYLVDAIHVAKQIKKPVQMLYTREADTKAGYYRPMGMINFKAYANQAKDISLELKMATQSLGKNFDGVLPEGLRHTAYQFQSSHMAMDTIKSPQSVNFWRSVGHSINGTFMEAFMDEVATELKEDPVALRRKLYKGDKRHTRVLNKVASMSQWGKKKLPKGHGYGLSIHKSFGSIVGQVAQVSVENGEVKVHKVYCAVDCGFAVNPDAVVAQMESGIIYGLTAVLWGEITHKNGAVEQSNFHDYRMLKNDETPDISVAIIDSQEASGGVGEPGTPPIGGAVLNAIHSATGKRVRKLPISKNI